METKIKLNQEERLDILTTAIESNAIQYWACDYGLITIKRHEETSLILRAEFSANDQNDTKQKYVVTAETIQKGIDAIFSPGFEVAKYIKEQISVGEFDALISDCVIQAALFGELVYG